MQPKYPHVHDDLQSLHAAHHTAVQEAQPFAVQLLTAEGEAVELAGGFADLLDAVDFAVEWLDREEPARDGAHRLVITQTHDGASVEVWRYPAERHGQQRQLIEHYGFDPTTWDAAAHYRDPRPIGRSSKART